MFTTEAIKNQGKSGTEGRWNGVVGGASEKMSVWVVDEDENLRNRLTQMLEKFHFKCSQQFSSTEAVLGALAAERPPHLVLMDYDLRGNTSLEAISRVKAIAPSTRLVVMTPSSDPAITASAMVSGADGVLSKPRDWELNLECLLKPHLALGLIRRSLNAIRARRALKARASAGASSRLLLSGFEE